MKVHYYKQLEERTLLEIVTDQKDGFVQLTELEFTDLWLLFMYKMWHRYKIGVRIIPWLNKKEFTLRFVFFK